MSEQATSLGEALPKEQARVRGVLGIYHQIGPAGQFGALMIEGALRRADEAVMNGDLVKMIQSYEELKGIRE